MSHIFDQRIDDYYRAADGEDKLCALYKAIVSAVDLSDWETILKLSVPGSMLYNAALQKIEKFKKISP